MQIDLREAVIDPHRPSPHQPLPRSDIAFQMKDLLPGAEDGFADGEEDDERRAEQGGLEMVVFTTSWA